MKNIQLEKLGKYQGNPNFAWIEGTIYKDLEEDHYVVALSYELEETEDSQYPLEDILDKFYLHVSDFIDEAAFYSSKSVVLELAGSLEDVKQAIDALIGKRVYNEEFEDEKGETRVRLVIV